MEEDVDAQFRTIKDFDSEFKLGERIGKGAHGNVHKATHIPSGITVAVKSRDIYTKKELQEMMDEIEMMRTSESPYVVKFFGNHMSGLGGKQGRKKAKMWIVMEYCLLGSIQDIMTIRKKPLSEPQICCICANVLRGIAYLHSNKKIHRDVKSANILMDEEGEAKLADFGISGRLHNTMDKKSTLIGTSHFLAPEVVMETGEGYDAKVDIWSLGITLVEMAEMVPPRYDEHPMKVIFSIPNNPPPTLRTPSAWSREFNDFIAKCLVKDPIERATAQSLLSHPFILKANQHKASLKEIVNETLLVSRNRASRVFSKEPSQQELLKEKPSLVPNDRVWIPHATQAFVLGTVKSLIGRDVIVTTETGEESTRPMSALVKCHSLDTTFDDMVTMPDLNEPSLLHNLRRRFEEGLIYTSIGSIIVAVNPYLVLPLYGTAVMTKYHHLHVKQELPPHLYGLAERMYYNLFHFDAKNQSAIIGGESGAGKTESAKIIMAYLAQVSAPTSTLTGADSSLIALQSKIVKANVVLESFGNAKTVKNNNSSRFGKFVKVQFNSLGKISGASISHYLLEKSRIAQQAQTERNYHIFYQFCAGADYDMRNRFHLGRAETFNYLSKGGCVGIEGVDDLMQFNEVKDAMIDVGLTDSDIHQVFQVLAALLHLGNVTFLPRNDHAMVFDLEAIITVSSLLGLSHLERCLCNRTIISPRKKGSTYTISLTVDQALDSRDALAKALYAALFDWLVQAINGKLVSKNPLMSNKFIAILDVMGFEIFETNSFEQLCINYTNEKLQQYFNNYVFKIEREEYLKEEIDVEDFSYSENDACIDLIERKMGIFALLDEQTKFPKATDLTFVEKLKTELNEDPNFIVKKKRKPTEFTILHFAGEVTYDGQSFLEKNKDTIYPDLILGILGSSNQFIVDLFESLEDSLKNSQKTLSSKFKVQLNSLTEVLSHTEPNFVRCLKSNSTKEGQKFDSCLILTQMRYSGILEAVKIRKAGFTIRKTFDEFYSRFRVLAPKNFAPKDRYDSCKIILKNVPQLRDLSDHSSRYRFGKTKIFFKEREYYGIEIYREIQVNGHVTKIQRAWKIHLEKKEFQKKRKAAIAMQTLIRRRQDLIKWNVIVKDKRSEEVALVEKRAKDSRRLLKKSDSERMRKARQVLKKEEGGHGGMEMSKEEKVDGDDEKKDGRMSMLDADERVRRLDQICQELEHLEEESRNNREEKELLDLETNTKNNVISPPSHRQVTRTSSTPMYSSEPPPVTTSRSMDKQTLKQLSQSIGSPEQIILAESPASTRKKDRAPQKSHHHRALSEDAASKSKKEKKHRKPKDGEASYRSEDMARVGHHHGRRKKKVNSNLDIQDITDDNRSVASEGASLYGSTDTTDTADEPTIMSAPTSPLPERKPKLFARMLHGLGIKKS
eukprot:TRINITY_DN6156_c0_g1_i1.p1 TRINITY_DN6156_c0_g1~~TRINITY_DN6156_c0_g1_i1.p1  ORF type:complete len:1408 (-),score=424.58 TRINITY_DN6156_c0_g1_i1:57-4280(-)